MASPAPALVINEAKWCATKGGMDITVTDVCAKLVAERGAGKYLYLHNSENKAALFGNPWPKVTKELWIRYTYLGEPKTETFHETQEIFLGDVEACFQSQSDNYGYIEDSVADALLFRFRPILKLHPSETSYPARVDWYLPQTALYLDFNGGQYCVLDKINNPADVIRSYSTANYNFHTREKRRFFFKHLNTESVRYGEGPNKLPQVPYYCTCNATEDGDICLTYFFFYAYNGPIMENPLVPAKIRQIAGTHQGDWEYVAIRVSPDGQDIRAVHMSRHTGAEGKWYLAACPEASRDAGWHIDPVKGRVVVYPGCESHANYNVPGRQDRGHGGFVDDKCGDGAVWDPEYIVNLGSIGRPRTPWTRFGGLWGKLQEAKLEGGGPEGPVLKSSFFGRTYPMKPDNCIPVFGSWWTEMKTQSDARINAAGRSLIKKGSKPAVSPLPMVPSALTDDHADFESGAYAAIPVPGSAAPAGDIDVGRGFPPGPAPPSAPVAPGASPMQHWSSESLIGARSFGPGGPGGITAPPTYAPPAPQAKRTDMLESSGEVAETSLSHDTHLVSPNGEYHLWMQSDGNVVLYQRANGGSPVWSSRTKGLGMAPYTLVCQGDGNVVVYDGNRRPTWKTDTYDKNPKGPYRFIVQNDRNIVLLDRINKVVWAAGSDQSKPSEFGKTLM